MTTNVVALPSPQNTTSSSNSAEAQAQPSPSQQASVEPASAAPKILVDGGLHAALENLKEILENPAVGSELAAHGAHIDAGALQAAIEDVDTAAQMKATAGTAPAVEASPASEPVDETLKTPITATEKEALSEEGVSIVLGTHPEEHPEDHELDRFHDDGGPHPPETAATAALDVVPAGIADRVAALEHELASIKIVMDRHGLRPQL